MLRLLERTSYYLVGKTGGETLRKWKASASKDLVPQRLAKFFVEIKRSHCHPSDRGQSGNL